MTVAKQNKTPQIAWPGLVIGIVFIILLTWFNGRPEAVGLLPVPWEKVAHGLIFGGLTLTFGLSVGGGCL